MKAALPNLTAPHYSKGARVALSDPSGQPGKFQAGEFSSMSQPSAIIFDIAEVQPPSLLYIGRDDVLVLSLSTSLAGAEVVNLFGRLLLPSGIIVPFQAAVKSTGADPTPQLAPINLSEGFLLSVSLNAAVANGVGQTYCRLWLNRGPVNAVPRNSMQLLLAGYVMTDTPLGWPGGVQQNSVQGGGGLIQGSAGNPSAGADFTIASSVSTRRRVASITATLTTSAAVANRFPHVQIKQGATVLYMAPPNQAIAAGQAVVVTFSGTALSAAPSAAVVNVPLPSPCLLAGNHSIAIVTSNMQAADQWTNIAFEMEQWIDAG